MKSLLIIIIVLLPALVVVSSATAAPDDDPVERASLTALFNSTDGPNWHRYEKWGSAQSICTWQGVWCMAGDYGLVTHLYLNNNNLTGPIPPELGNLGHLEWLKMDDNDLSGPIPPELGSFSDLQFLDLSFNDLDGPIPPEMGQLNYLLWLLLRNNDLSGVIPSTLSNLQNLIGLDLSENPKLSCWETIAARIWSLGLPFYEGSTETCEDYRLLWLPFICRGGAIIDEEQSR